MEASREQPARAPRLPQHAAEVMAVGIFRLRMTFASRRSLLAQDDNGLNQLLKSAVKSVSTILESRELLRKTM